MEKLRKISLLILCFAAGLLSGAFLRLGYEVQQSRPHIFGGERLILPLVILLIVFGYQLHKGLHQ